MKKSMKVLCFCAGGLLLAAAAVFGLQSARASESVQSTTFSMGSPVQQTVYGPSGAQTAAKAAQAVSMLDRLLSWRLEGSDIARVNAAAGTSSVQVDAKTARLLAQNLDIANRSHGALDPTVQPVSSLWNFDGTPAVPETNILVERLALVDYTRLRLDENSAFLETPGMALDLGAIGKGAACDEALAVYREAGTPAVIAVGGSVGVYGQKPGGGPWAVAVRNPDSGGDKNATLGQLSLESGCVSTSGSYEKVFTQNGVTYHHLLDPKTGFPAQTGLISVTVVHENGGLSDALATAAFVLGFDKGLALLTDYGAEGIFVDASKHVSVTKGLKARFTLTDNASGWTRVDL